jgi:hypothetical protein
MHDLGNYPSRIKIAGAGCLNFLLRIHL